MISEERLKELFKEEATIYMVNGYVEEIDLNEYDFRATDKELVFNYEIYAIRFECLFETEEEANEYLKYGNVARTEKFPYVSFEEFCRGKIIRCGDMEYKTTYWIKKEANHIKMYKFYNGSSNGEFFDEPLTRENYHKALDICVELFKRENYDLLCD